MNCNGKGSCLLGRVALLLLCFLLIAKLPLAVLADTRLSHKAAFTGFAAPISGSRRFLPLLRPSDLGAVGAVWR